MMSGEPIVEDQLDAPISTKILSPAKTLLTDKIQSPKKTLYLPIKYCPMHPWRQFLPKISRLVTWSGLGSRDIHGGLARWIFILSNVLKIENYDMLNDQVMDNKPKGDSHLPVHFFGSRDFAWFSRDSLKPLQQHWKDYAKKNNTNLFKTALLETEDPDCLLSPAVTKKKSSAKRKTMDDADIKDVPAAKRVNKRRSAHEGDEVVCGCDD
jgi:hypothetical protein